jgi:diguanylate cyclase (GGDEF)-like protein
MSLERERLLLKLSLECSAAREPLAAVQAMRVYLRTRYQPEKIIEEEYRDGAYCFIAKHVFATDTNEMIFLLPLMVGVVFRMSGYTEEGPDAHEIETIEKIGRFFREKQAQFAELRGLTYTDDLTGLYNQRYMELILDREIALAKRGKTPFSILFLDLDHFKAVNDNHGHLIGSRILYEVGAEIKKTLRESDITFRYGGDEFVMVLTGTGLEDALMVAERIREKIEIKRFLAKDNLAIRITASIGVATFPQHAASKEDILRAADEALYGVKTTERNKVTAANLKYVGESK